MHQMMKTSSTEQLPKLAITYRKTYIRYGIQEGKIAHADMWKYIGVIGPYMYIADRLYSAEHMHRTNRNLWADTN